MLDILQAIAPILVVAAVICLLAWAFTPRTRKCVDPGECPDEFSGIVCNSCAGSWQVTPFMTATGYIFLGIADVFGALALRTALERIPGGEKWANRWWTLAELLDPWRWEATAHAIGVLSYAESDAIFPDFDLEDAVLYDGNLEEWQAIMAAVEDEDSASPQVDADDLDTWAANRVIPEPACEETRRAINTSND